jgi:hypothetical protein
MRKGCLRARFQCASIYLRNALHTAARKQQEGQEMTETAVAADALIELENERNRQITQRIAVTQAACRLRKEFDEAPCHDGVNDWLRDHDVPSMGSEFRSGPLSEEELRTAAARFLPPVENLDWYSAEGIRGKLLPELRTAGERWLTRIVTELRRLGDVREDVPSEMVRALITELTGVTGRELQITVTFVVDITQDAPDNMIQAAAEDVIRTALGRTVDDTDGVTLRDGITVVSHFVTERS